MAICEAPTPQHAKKSILSERIKDAESPRALPIMTPTFTIYAPQPEQEELSVKSKVAPSLTRAEYFSNPSCDEMDKMSEEELKQIDNFEIGRHGFGSVKWPGLSDVRGLDLDQIINIGDGTVSLYPNESKPAAGTALNKMAVISLKVKRDARSPEHAAKLKERIQQLTEKAGHKFISYDLDTWTFSVPSFDA